MGQNFFPSTATVDACDSPPRKWYNPPQQKKPHLDVSEDETEMDSVIMVNMLHSNSENSHWPAISHDMLPDDPPATIQPEPQPAYFEDPVQEPPHCLHCSCKTVPEDYCRPTHQPLYSVAICLQASRKQRSQ